MNRITLVNLFVLRRSFINAIDIVRKLVKAADESKDTLDFSIRCDTFIEEARELVRQTAEPEPYGRCPICGKKGISRERRPNGNDTCEEGHVYPSKNSIFGNVIPNIEVLSWPKL